MRAINNYAYLGFVPWQDHGEALEQQMVQHRRALALIIPQLADLWERVWLPSILPGLDRLRTFDYAALTDSALLDALAELRVELAARWRAHRRIPPVSLAARDLTAFYRDPLQPTAPTNPYLPSPGFPTHA